MARPLKVAELERHPEFPYVTWDLKPTKRGKLSIAEGRGGPFNLSYEIHGHGPRHLLVRMNPHLFRGYEHSVYLGSFVMGLGGLKSAWQRQTKDFGHTRADEYSVLVFDNRGIGDSDKPFMRYSTSEMARDTLELLDHVGWTALRSVNVVGVSMGGMICQELGPQDGLLIPDRIASMTLTSTAARLVNTIGYMENLRNRINLFIPKSLDQQIANAKYMIYTPSYLASPDTLEPTVKNFPTSGDRFAASELSKRKNPDAFTRTGFVAQAVAAGWHHKSREDMQKLGDRVGRSRICVVHGTIDRMITFPHGQTLVEELRKGDESVREEFFEGQAHVIPIEKREDFNRILNGMAA